MPGRSMPTSTPTMHTTTPHLNFSETHPGPLVVPTLVITEVVYLLGSRLGADAEVRFLGDLAAGHFAVEPVAAPDWLRIAELVARYRDLPLGTADASVVAAAERLWCRDHCHGRSAPFLDGTPTARRVIRVAP